MLHTHQVHPEGRGQVAGVLWPLPAGPPSCPPGGPLPATRPQLPRRAPADEMLGSLVFQLRACRRESCISSNKTRARLVPSEPRLPAAARQPPRLGGLGERSPNARSYVRLDACGSRVGNIYLHMPVVFRGEKIFFFFKLWSPNLEIDSRS